MRMSCNGCRILRKGCSENCSIRPCLHWIKSPESQANATVFLAKFYGRAGLMNLINAGPEHLRPAIFRSLLYEACGRIVNPIYGSVGLLWSGSWQLCQSAVEAVLKGNPITQINSEAAASSQGPPLKAYDIRHVSKDDQNSADLHKVRTRCRFKRTAKPKTNNISATTNDDHTLESDNQSFRVVFRSGHSYDEVNRSTSHDSSVSHPVEPENTDRESREAGSRVSVDTAEGAEPDSFQKQSDEEGADDCVGLDLELTLGFESMSRAVHVAKEIVVGSDTCKMELAFD